MRLSRSPMRFLLLLLLLGIAGGCAPVAPRPAPAAARPVPVVVVPPPPSVEWRDRPVTPGTWRYVRDGHGTVALFGRPGTDALAVLRCDLVNHRLFLSRAGALAAPFTVRTSSVTRQLPTGLTGGVPPYTAATIPAADPLLDAIAFSRGRWALEQAGAPPLQLPAWAEPARVIEDCRG